jgi:hypothetical protein
MTIKISVSNRVAYTFVASVIILIAAGFVIAQYTNPIPNPGHGGNTVWVATTGGEMTLQDAIDQGVLGGQQTAGVPLKIESQWMACGECGDRIACADQNCCTAGWTDTFLQDADNMDNINKPYHDVNEDNIVGDGIVHLCLRAVGNAVGTSGSSSGKVMTAWNGGGDLVMIDVPASWDVQRALKFIQNKNGAGTNPNILNYVAYRTGCITSSGYSWSESSGNKPPENSCGW